MASKELTQALNDLTAAVQLAIPLLKPNSDAETIAAIAPLTAALVAAMSGSVTVPPVPSDTVQSFRVASVPSDLSTLQLNGAPLFQFFLPGSFPGSGIGVPLKAGATPSDVIDALIVADGRVSRISSDSFAWSNPGPFSGTSGITLI